MMSFMDMTFCASKTCMNECGRKMSESMRKRAEELKAPIAWACFCSDETEDFQYIKQLDERYDNKQ